MTFADDTAVTRIAPGCFTTNLSERWLSLIAIHGGYSAATLVRAMDATVDDTTRRLRTIAVQFSAPPQPGNVDIAVHIERAGRSATVTTARMRQAGKVVLVAHAVHARRLGGITYDELTRPTFADPGATPVFVPPGDVAVPHFRNIEVRMDPDVTLFGGGDDARIAAWIRPPDGGAIDAAWIVAMCDALPPALFSRTTGPVPAATIELVVHLATGDPHLPPGDHVFLECHSPLSRDGFAVENATMWSPDGTVLATAHQTRLAGG